MATTIVASALTTFALSPDGSRVRFNVRDDEGEVSALDLPAGCVNQLLMTLPRIIKESLRQSCGDQSMRLAYPMEAFQLERGDVGDDGVQHYLLTLQTEGSFEVTFSIKDKLLAFVAQTIGNQVVERGEPVHPAALNS
ncbi:MAG: hypothetical protein WDO12_01470 [Pseudomonadota bacterium]